MQGEKHKVVSKECTSHDVQSMEGRVLFIILCSRFALATAISRYSPVARIEGGEIRLPFWDLQQHIQGELRELLRTLPKRILHVAEIKIMKNKPNQRKER